MNYSKSTQAPITDAARFFSENGEKLRFEDKLAVSARKKQVERENHLRNLGRVMI